MNVSAYSRDDVRWMRRALTLAARGYTPPNPQVGCVLVREGHIVGEGWHAYAGGPHAEAAALAAAGEAAQGSTAYVTLEPCTHHGRTPPCSLALINAGVRRVVAAIEDPNPRVSGGGFSTLRSAGIEVEVGLLSAEAAYVNAPFLHFQKSGSPFVALKAATTLDGKIATRTGDSRWVTGERARGFVQRLRAQYGAILCGVGTVLIDDPLLTARFPRAPRTPVRVVLDSQLRTPPDSRLALTAGDVPTIVFCGVGASVDREKILQSYRVEIVRLPTDTNGHILLRNVVAELGKREIVSVLVEGGGVTNAGFLAESLANRVYWFVAPKLIGGREAPTSLEGTGAGRMDEAVLLENVRVKRIGPDVLIEGTPVYGPPV